jgi:hypothetical protein
MTLAQLSDACDELIGCEAGLLDHLSAYRAGRETVAAIRAPERVSARAAACEAAAARGADNDGRRRLRAVPSRVAHRLTGEAVRKAHPTLWADARPVAWSLSVAVGPAWRPVRIPAIRAGTVAQLIETVAWDHQAARRAQASADAARAALIGVYQGIDDARPWGGVPLLTDDGWAIGYTARPTFSATACRELAEVRGIDLTPCLHPMVTGGGWRVVTIGEHGSTGDRGDETAD